jgi:hypothetical protein
MDFVFDDVQVEDVLKVFENRVIFSHQESLQDRDSGSIPEGRKPEHMVNTG